jgi:hypothetical protein
MKKFVVTICFLLITFSVFSQETFKKNFVSSNLVGFIFGDGSISYERVLNNKNGLRANFAFGMAKNKGNTYTLNAYTLAHRYYFKGNANNGWLINTELGYSSVTADDKILKETSNSYIWRLYGSRKWTFKKGLSLEAGAGADGLGTNFKNDKYDGFFVPLYPYLNLSIGYAF